MKNVWRITHLLIFPFAELICLAASILLFKEHLGWSIFSLILTALFLNFSLHITFHYQVHFKHKVSRVNTVIELLSSLLMGIPFKNYQMGHLSHHKYNNNLGDFTSTWKGKPQHPKAKNPILYSFFWFLNIRQAQANKLQAKKEGYLHPKAIQEQRMESLFLVILIIGFFYWSLAAGVIYLISIYLGWSLIALHNYGQHPPLKYGNPKGYSFYHTWYNLIFINNGWHEEHHENPSLSYWDLKAYKNKGLKLPHLLEGLLPSLKNPKKDA